VAAQKKKRTKKRAAYAACWTGTTSTGKKAKGVGKKGGVSEKSQRAKASQREKKHTIGHRT